MDFEGDIGLWQRRVGQTPEGVSRRSSVFGALDPQPGERILDVGCGGGHLLRELALAVTPGGTAVGIDVNQDQIGAAREYCADVANAEVLQADVLELQLDDHSFDGVSSIQVLEYISAIDEALREIRRMMKRGGRAAFLSVLWDTFRFHGADPTLNERMMEAFRAHCPHQMLPAEMSGRMPTAGMEVVEQRPVAFFNGAMHENAIGFWASRIVAAFSRTQGVAAEDAETWLHQLAAADQAGRYGFVSVAILTVGRAT